MSIINEALKKAQKETGAIKEGKPTPQIQHYESGPSNKIKTKIRLSVVLAILAACFLSPTLIIGLSLLGKSGKPSYTPETTIVSEVPKIETKNASTEPRIDASAYRSTYVMPSTFELSGIVLGAGKPFAVINNRIVEIGDEIAGHKVFNIEKDKVMLRKGDEEITLDLR